MIRKAIRNDLNIITDIYNEAILEGGFTGDLEPLSVSKRLGWFTDHEANYTILVYSVDEFVVGYVALSPYRKGRQAFNQTCEISYYVFKEYRGRGIGKKLINAALAYAQESGFKTLLAIILACNQHSIDLLKRFGFIVCGQLPKVAHICGKDVDHLYLSRNLLYPITAPSE